LPPAHAHRNLPGGDPRPLQALHNSDRRDAASTHHLRRSHSLSLECHALPYSWKPTFHHSSVLLLRLVPSVPHRAESKDQLAVRANVKVTSGRAAAWRRARKAPHALRAVRVMQRRRRSVRVLPRSVKRDKSAPTHRCVASRMPAGEAVRHARVVGTAAHCADQRACAHAQKRRPVVLCGTDKRRCTFAELRYSRSRYTSTLL
jgi:hypothetical protein